jgi:hypothetical protein
VRRVVLLAALTCGFAVVPPAHAGMPWWRAQTVASFPPDRGVYETDVALVGNARGRRAIAWPAPGGIRVAIAPPGQGFGRSRLLRREKSSAGAPHLAMSSSGDTLVVYHYFDGTYTPPSEARESDCCEGVRVAVVRRDGRIGRVRTLTPRAIGVYLEGFAIDGHGRYGVVWEEYDKTSDYYRVDDDPNGPARPGLLGRFSTGHGLGAPQKSDRREGVALSYARGRPRVLIFAGGAQHRLVERVAHRSGRFGARRTLARDLPPEPVIATAASERGDQVLAWADAHSVHAGTRAPGARLRHRTVAHVEHPDAPAVAIGPSGRAAVVWGREHGGLWLATSRGRAHRFGAAARVWTLRRGRRAGVRETELAVDRLGRVALGWLADYGSTIHAAIFEPAGGRTRHTTFRGRHDGQLPVQPTATFDDHGRASIVWLRGHDIRVARTAAPR